MHRAGVQCVEDTESWVHEFGCGWWWHVGFDQMCLVCLVWVLCSMQLDGRWEMQASTDERCRK